MFPLKDDNPTNKKPYVTITLIVSCILIFLYQSIIPNEANNELIFKYGMRPIELFSIKIYEQSFFDVIISLFSSMFLHGGVMHLLGNLLFLWIYGNNIEDVMGHFKFFFFYIICGLSAAFLQASITPASSIPMIGASGAISGVLSAYFLLFPRAKVSTLIVFFIFITVVKIPAGILIGIWFITQLTNAYLIDPSSPGVAWYAHLGGFISGAILIPFLKDKNYKFFSSGNSKSRIKKKHIKLRFKK